MSEVTYQGGGGFGLQSLFVPVYMVHILASAIKHLRPEITNQILHPKGNISYLTQNQSMFS